VPAQVGVLQEHHGEYHLWGDSTTQSREMKKYDLIFRTSCLPLIDSPVTDARQLDSVEASVRACTLYRN
jgi:hypothetical protein